MSDISYKFSIKIGNFQFEVEGDKNFVEKTLTRYEGRFLPRFQQLMDKVPVVVEQKQAVAQDNPSNPTVSQSSPQKQESVHESDRGAESRKDSRRNRRRAERRRNNSRHSNNRVMPPPPVAHPQEVVKQPYIPPEIEDEPQSASSEEEELVPFPVPVVSESVPADMTSHASMHEETAPQADNEDVSQSSPDISAEEAKEDVKEDKEQPQEEGDSGVLKELYEKLNPKTHHEKVMVFGYFLQTHRGMKEFGTSRLKSCYRLVGAEPAGNINQVLNHASRTGFINKLQRGRAIKYSLTSKGKQFIERELNNNNN